MIPSTTRRTTGAAVPAGSRGCSSSSTARAGSRPPPSRLHGSGRWLGAAHAAHARRLRGPEPAVVAGRPAPRVRLRAPRGLGRRDAPRPLRRRRRGWRARGADQRAMRGTRRPPGRRMGPRSPAASGRATSTSRATARSPCSTRDGRGAASHDRARPELRSVSRGPRAGLGRGVAPVRAGGQRATRRSTACAADGSAAPEPVVDGELSIVGFDCVEGSDRARRLASDRARRALRGRGPADRGVGAVHERARALRAGALHGGVGRRLGGRGLADAPARFDPSRRYPFC